MKKKEFKFEYSEIHDQAKLDPVESRLISKAKAAAKNAWAPYSGFMVGAAVLLENNEIITGNNQENAAFPSGICAERTAVYYANSLFPEVPVKTIAIAACINDKFLPLPIVPCGSCRQVILETQNRFKKPVKILMYGEEKTYVIENAAVLLPFPFEGF